MAKKGEQPVERVTNFFAVCANSDEKDVHIRPVAVPLRKDRFGSFYSVCFCGARTFYGKARRKGMTYEQATARGLQPLARDS